MTSDELRQAYLDFFASKGHKIIPSSSLIPHGDPTLLLTTAGMVQIKPYFTGEAVPPSPRLASCQKCFRTTDIDSVGDATHLTFFEMLGNFSVGDYFKKEAINWAWEFVTQHLKLPPERLWVTIFLDDDEAFNFWREIGIPESKIVRLGEKDNFWGPAGDSGPCGPCSEIHYDLGRKAGCDKPDCAPGCDCKRYIEIWNLVFTEYTQDKNGKRTKLPKPNIDTGMGLERTVTVVNGKGSVYDTNIFAPILNSVSEISGKKYGASSQVDNAMRVVAEHSRAITFLITDGVLPGNEGRGYVLRRLLRRAVLFGKKLGLNKAFLTQTASAVIDQMKSVYPALEQRRDFVLKVIGMEEARFEETLNTGLELLDKVFGTSAANKTLSGKDAFKLYDTYGFPIEITKEIAAERGFAVDVQGFEREMNSQRERARSAHKFETAESGIIAKSLNLKETIFTGYETLKQETEILNILGGGDSVGDIGAGQEAEIILKETPFYGEMGGQVGDAGELRSSKGRFIVTDTIHITPEIIAHKGKVIDGALSVGDIVEAAVDTERRRDIARNHTATHLLQAGLRSVLGEHIQQRGSLVTPDRLRFDFSHLAAMTVEEIERVQRFVNDKVRQNLPVSADEMPYKQAIQSGAIAFFDEKYGDTVRLLCVGKPPISAELCGGTHILASGEIGFFQILSEGSVGAGVRRIEAVTGRGAEEYIRQKMLDIQKIAVYVEAKPEEAVNQTHNVVNELKNERRRAQELERELGKLRADSLAAGAETLNGITFIAAKAPSCRIEVLREMSDMLRDKLGSAVIVLGTVYEDKPLFLASVTADLVGKGFDAGKIIKDVAGVAGGGGGGKPNLAQAGGKDKSKVDDALKQVRKYIEAKTSAK